MCLPLLLDTIIRGEDMPCWRLLIVIDADGCCLRGLGGEESCTIYVQPILRLWPLIMLPCPSVDVANEATAEDHGLDVTLIVSLPIGLRITGRQTKDTRYTDTLRELTYRVIHH
jgi:hypothetical protein